jgi:hypothetical protein
LNFSLRQFEKSPIEIMNKTRNTLFPRTQMTSASGWNMRGIIIPGLAGKLKPN